MPSCTACSSAPEGSAADRTGALTRALQRCWYRPVATVAAASSGRGVCAGRAMAARRVCARDCAASAPARAGRSSWSAISRSAAAGKTPLVIWLSEQLRARGIRPGVVLRGYGGAQSSGRASRCWSSATAAPRWSGDEAVLLRAAHARAGGRRPRPRARGAAAARKPRRRRHRDDGLQHLRLARDVEIVVIDGERGTGQWLSAARGTAARAGRAAGQRRCHRPQWRGRRRGNRRGREPVRRCCRCSCWAIGCSRWPAARSVPLASLPAGACMRWRGSVDRERFFEQLRAAGLEVLAHAFPDHHRYRAAELRVRRRSAAADDREGCGKMPRLRGERRLVPAGRSAAFQSEAHAARAAGRARQPTAGAALDAADSQLDAGD